MEIQKCENQKYAWKEDYKSYCQGCGEMNRLHEDQWGTKQKGRYFLGMTCSYEYILIQFK